MLPFEARTGSLSTNWTFDPRSRNTWAPAVVADHRAPQTTEHLSTANRDIRCAAVNEAVLGGLRSNFHDFIWIETHNAQPERRGAEDIVRALYS